VFRVNGSSPPGNQEFRVPRTALTAGMMGAVAATVSAGLLLSAGAGPSSGRLDRVKASVSVVAPSGTVTARPPAGPRPAGGKPEAAPALQKSK
jgi:hypothetical protein